MDKLFSHRFYEAKAQADRRAFKNTDKGDNLETVENRTEKRVGVTKARPAEMAIIELVK